MLQLTIADLVHRRRQFSIAIGGTALVLGLALVMFGMSNSFRVEIDTTVSDVGADHWAVAERSSGPLTDLVPVPADVVDQFRDQPGVDDAAPMVFANVSAATPDGRRDTVNLLGHLPGELGTPTVTSGRPIEGPGEAVVDRRLSVDVGDLARIAGIEVEVVGLTTGHSMFGGLPNAYIALEEVQDTLFAGLPVVTIVAVRGDPQPVEGMTTFSADEVESNGLTTLSSAISSVDTNRAFMFAVALLIVAGLMFVTALERSSDFAVMKAIGATNRYIFATVALEAVLVTGLAALLGLGLGTLMQSFFALPVSIQTSAYLLMPLVALATGLVASLAALRRVVTTDPAEAFA